MSCSRRYPHTISTVLTNTLFRTHLPMCRQGHTTHTDTIRYRRHFVRFYSMSPHPHLATLLLLLHCGKLQYHHHNLLLKICKNPFLFVILYSANLFAEGEQQRYRTRTTAMSYANINVTVRERQATTSNTNNKANIKEGELQLWQHETSYRKRQALSPTN